mmetsp:Transcript_95470/g.169508  ORF Transcript_95470/g.169508 Transcript_95470/m.169508 type:complete len:348 (-) Transcript_95470:204-1247(-)
MATCVMSPWVIAEVSGELPESLQNTSLNTSEGSSRNQSSGDDSFSSGCQFASEHQVQQSEDTCQDSLSLHASNIESRTVIILDWDDTLFPLTYVRDDLRLDPHLPLQEQRIPEAMKRDVGSRLARCSEQAVKLLAVASSLGRVMLVTLSRNSWVAESARNFCPELQEAMQALSLSVFYAEQPAADSPAADAGRCIARQMSGQDLPELRFWTNLKAKAIGQGLRELYGEGDSCTSLLSIGDSDFERFGTKQAAEEYVQSSVSKVRAKTFKTMEKPSIDELTSQLAQLTAWLPLMASTNHAFDVHLTDIDDRRCVRAIEQALQADGEEQRPEDRWPVSPLGSCLVLGSI